jgi:hypothetical protein
MRAPSRACNCTFQHNHVPVCICCNFLRDPSLPRNWITDIFVQKLTFAIQKGTRAESDPGARLLKDPRPMALPNLQELRLKRFLPSGFDSGRIWIFWT